jgi:hypothetical protein
MQQPMENPAMQAEALKGMGRGPDTQLMHVTDSEVNALNGLSGLVFNEPLRTNPETGLPEAGLFKQLLPTILAIGAGAFLGPGAASMFAGMGAGTAAGGVGALATGLGTGLAAFGGHALGRAATGQDFSLLKSGLAGLGAGATAGLTFSPDVGATVAGDFELAGAAAPSFDPATMVDAGTAASASSADAFNAMADASSNASFGGGFGGYEMGGSQQMLADLGSANPLPVTTDSSLLAGELSAGSTGYIPSPMPTPVPMTTGEQFIANARSPGEAYDYLAAEPMKRVVMPLGMAALSGDFDQPLPEAPSGPSRTPFTPKDFTFTRERRELDKNGDGEVSQEEIAQVVQGLPEGQSSRFYTRGAFTENEELNAKAGGLLRLQTGGNIQEAIGSLTGGAGASLLPLLAQSVVKPEDEEEESVSKGYPVGVAGTPPGAATTGMAIGGGQPPQPFEAGGLTALEEAFKNDAGGGDAGDGPGPSSGSGPSPSHGAGFAGSGIGAGPAGGPGTAGGTTGAGFGLGIGQGTNSGVDPAAVVGGLVGAIPAAPLGLGLLANLAVQQSQIQSLPKSQQPIFTPNILNPVFNQKQDKLFQHELNINREKEQAEAEAEQAEQEAFNTAMNAINQTMMEETEEDNLGSVAEAMGSASASGFGGFSGFGGIGGNVGEDDTTDDPDTSGNDPGPGGGESPGGNDGGFGSGSGPGAGFGDAGLGGPGDADGPGSGSGDDDGGPFQQGGYLGGVSSRAHGGLLQLAGGGSVPYFEGRVMPTGNMTEDGMSDNIPFVIAGRQEGGQMGMQPAVLSPDEYVIPADVVSSLGNGSSNAGANDLDQFINNFRMDKYGRPNQPPEMRGGLSSLG